MREPLKRVFIQWLPSALLSVAVARGGPPALLARPYGQTVYQVAATQGSNLEFEVVSIRRNDSGSSREIYGPPVGDRASYTNVTLRTLIRLAYRVQDFQISGGAGWLNSERYDISAKAENSGLTRSQVEQMLQSMLAKRFALAVHRENKDMALYALVKSRNDGKLAPGLRESSNKPCSSSPSPDARKPGQLPEPVCGQIAFDRGKMKGSKTDIGSVSAVLSVVLNRTVVDRTGLQGAYDLTLEWADDDLAADNARDPAAPASNGPSIFTALREQLGLKLDSERGPVEVLVVDRAEEPSDTDN
jgi:uncharacterized protein (TIGR03435 family)